VKLLALDDTLRPVMAGSGLPAALVAALRRWGEEPPCLREVLAHFAFFHALANTDNDAAQILTQWLLLPLLLWRYRC
jgi:hypothetical protein